jgi:hypothetical protein
VEKDNKKTSQGKDKSPKEGENLGKDCFGQGGQGFDAKKCHLVEETIGE